MPLKIFAFLSAFFFIFAGAPVVALDAVSWDNVAMDEEPPVDCATKILAEALARTGDTLTEDSSEYEIEAWVYRTFQDPAIIRTILECDTFKKATANEIVTISPIEYHFARGPGMVGDNTDGRTIIVNYAVPKKLLQDRLLLADRPKRPGGASEKISFDGTDEWINTEPSWYAIMVVQAGALDDYTGPDKNNTISLKYMLDHQAEFFPKNSHLGPITNPMPMCTSGSAFANDNDIVNGAAHKTQNEKPSWFSGNDYYIAGDVNLQWVTWAEVAGDVVLTIATLGTGTAITVGGKALRTARTAKNITNELRVLRKMDAIKDFNKTAATLASAERVAKNFDRVSDVASAVLRADDIADLTRGLESSANLMQSAKNWRTAEQNAARLETQLQNARRASDAADIRRRLTTARQDINRYRNGFKDDLLRARADKLDEITNLRAEVARMENLDDVKKYKTALDDFDAVKSLARDLKAWRIPQRGNFIARLAKTIGAERRATGVLGKAGRSMGRASTLSGRIRDGLFKNTLRVQSITERAAGAYVGIWGPALGIVKLVGDTYDWTNTSTYDYTSSLEFKPFGLLSADDLTGEENVVNRGMWIMWAGDGVSPTDDDAAYLQAMDTAQKFFEDMVETQDMAVDSLGYTTRQLCDVDIYVVHPIIRNPGVDNELYYLIMNDVPWQIRR